MIKCDDFSCETALKNATTFKSLYTEITKHRCHFKTFEPWRQYCLISVNTWKHSKDVCLK